MNTKTIKTQNSNETKGVNNMTTTNSKASTPAITNRSTDMEKFREKAILLLNTEVPEIGVFDNDTFSHPFWPCLKIYCGRAISESGFLDTRYPGDYQIAKAIKLEELNAATSPAQIFKMLSKVWDLRFLEKTKDMLSVDDLSEVLRLVWMRNVYECNPGMLSRQDVLTMFQISNPCILMNDLEYTIYRALPEELTVYRGFASYNKQLLRTFSWTLDLNVVANGPARSLRFGSYRFMAHTAKVRKQDVLAYFIRESEVVVNPRKLYDIGTCPF